MNLCLIDHITMAYGEVHSSPDGFYKIHILNMETDEWSLQNTVHVKGQKYVWDMSYMKTSDGTQACCSVARMTSQ